MRSYLDAHSNGEMNNKTDNIVQCVASARRNLCLFTLKKLYTYIVLKTNQRCPTNYEPRIGTPEDASSVRDKNKKCPLIRQNSAELTRKNRTDQKKPNSPEITDQKELN
ncbi:hypothetical protein TNCV_2339971 [Trichonephila clavipes]|nr:hypothetical protein TNCV_2339971 [Trichonephila clavipes]